MARNKSEHAAQVITQKVWLPKDASTHYRWKSDRGGSRAFMTKLPDGDKCRYGAHRGKLLPRYVITFQADKAYVQSMSMRYFKTKAEAQTVWDLLDKSPRIKEVPRGEHFEQLGEMPPRLGIEESWDGMTFPNGTVGPWDPNPDGTYPDFPTPYDGEADTYC